MTEHKNTQLNHKFSFYPGPIENVNPDPNPVTMEYIFKKTIMGDWKDQVILAKGNPLLKKRLPYFTPAGVFSSRANDNIISRSGFIVIDIDHHTDPEGLKNDILREIRPVLTFTSVSGQGVKVFFQYDPELDHTACFQALQRFFREKMRVDIDESGKDIARACFVSCDPGARYFDTPNILDRDFINRYNGHALAPHSKEPQANSFQVGNRNASTTLVAGVLHRGGVAEDLALKLLLPQSEPGFPENEIRATVKSIYSNPKYKGDEPFDPAAELEKSRINPLEEVKPPPVLIEISGQPCMSLGNISLIIGKAKAKKTFLMAALTASVLRGHPLTEIEGKITGTVLYFDTEQAEHDAYKNIRRITKMAKNDTLKAYWLRGYKPAERLQMIGDAIKKTPGLTMVVIDGIRDLLSKGINDEAEATEITSLLLKWSAVYKCHIVCVLHVNKADGNARGHVGAELTNKSESVLSVARDEQNPDASVIKPEYVRNMDWPPFGFMINSDGLPETCTLVTGGSDIKLRTIEDNLRRLLPEGVKMTRNHLEREYTKIRGCSISTAHRAIKEAHAKGIVKIIFGEYMINDQEGPQSETGSPVSIYTGVEP